MWPVVSFVRTGERSYVSAATTPTIMQFWWLATSWAPHRCRSRVARAAFTSAQVITFAPLRFAVLIALSRPQKGTRQPHRSVIGFSIKSMPAPTAARQTAGSTYFGPLVTLATVATHRFICQEIEEKSQDYPLASCRGECSMQVTISCKG